MFGPLWEWCLQEAKIIRQAPGVFFALLVFGISIAATGIWVAMEWRYAGMLANKDSEIAIREALIQQLREGMGSATSNAANGYILTSEQWARFVEQIEVPIGQRYRVHVRYNQNCTFCAVFAQGIVDRLAVSSGWEFDVGPAISDPRQQGIFVQVHSRNLIRDEAKTILRALLAAGLHAKFVEESSLPKSAPPLLFIGLPQ